MEKNISLLDHFLKNNKNKKVAIISHYNPDGDALGSAVAMYHIFKLYGYNAFIVMPNRPEEKLLFVYEGLPLFFFEEHDDIIEKMEQTDLLCWVDFSSKTIIDRMQPKLQSILTQSKMTIVIDHHQEKPYKGDLQIWIPSAESTTAIIYHFISNCCKDLLKNNHLRQALYLGLATDTCFFKTSNVTPFAHDMASELIKLGVKPHIIHEKIQNSFSLKKIRFLGKALSHYFFYYEKGRMCYFFINQKNFQNFQLKKSDLRVLITYGLSIKEALWVTIITEKDGQFLLSFRSKNNFNVANIAKKFFHGGGHQCAAGGISKLSINATISKLKTISESTF